MIFGSLSKDAHFWKKQRILFLVFCLSLQVIPELTIWNSGIGDKIREAGPQQLHYKLKYLKFYRFNGKKPDRPTITNKNQGLLDKQTILSSESQEINKTKYLKLNNTNSINQSDENANTTTKNLHNEPSNTYDNLKFSVSTIYSTDSSDNYLPTYIDDKLALQNTLITNILTSTTYFSQQDIENTAQIHSPQSKISSSAYYPISSEIIEQNISTIQFTSDNTVFSPSISSYITSYVQQAPVETPSASPIQIPNPTKAPQSPKKQSMLNDTLISGIPTLASTANTIHLLHYKYNEKLINEPYTVFTTHDSNRCEVHIFIYEDDEELVYAGRYMPQHICFCFGAKRGIIQVVMPDFECYFTYSTFMHKLSNKYCFLTFPPSFEFIPEKNLDKKSLKHNEIVNDANNAVKELLLNKTQAEQNKFYGTRRNYVNFLMQKIYFKFPANGRQLIFIDTERVGVYISSPNILKSVICKYENDAYVPFAQITPQTGFNTILIGDRKSAISFEGKKNTEAAILIFKMNDLHIGFTNIQTMKVWQTFTPQEEELFVSYIHGNHSLKEKFKNMEDLPDHNYFEKIISLPSKTIQNSVAYHENPILYINEMFTNESNYFYYIPYTSVDIFFPNLEKILVHVIVFENNQNSFKYLGSIDSKKQNSALSIRQKTSLLYIESLGAPDFEFILVNNNRANCKITRITKDKDKVVSDVPVGTDTFICNLRLFDKTTPFKLLYRFNDTSRVSIYKPFYPFKLSIQMNSGPYYSETHVPLLEVVHKTKNERFYGEYFITDKIIKKNSRLDFILNQINKDSLTHMNITKPLLPVANNSRITKIISDYMKIPTPTPRPPSNEWAGRVARSIYVSEPQNVTVDFEKSRVHEIFIEQKFAFVVVPEFKHLVIKAFTREGKSITFVGDITSNHIGVAFGNISSIIYVESKSPKNFTFYIFQEKSFETTVILKKVNISSTSNYSLNDYAYLDKLALEVETFRGKSSEENLPDLKFRRYCVRLDKLDKIDRSEKYDKTEKPFKDVFIKPGSTIIFTNLDKINVSVFRNNHLNRLIPSAVLSNETGYNCYQFGFVYGGALRITSQITQNLFVEFIVLSHYSSVSSFPFKIEDMIDNVTITKQDAENSIKTLNVYMSKTNFSLSSINENQTAKNIPTQTPKPAEEDKKKTRVKAVVDDFDEYFNNSDTFPNSFGKLEWRNDRYHFSVNVTFIEGYSYPRSTVWFTSIILTICTIIGAVYFTSTIYGIFNPQNIEELMQNLDDEQLGVEYNDFEEDYLQDTEKEIDDDDLQDLNPT